MRRVKTESGTKIWLSANDTYAWAHRPGNAWPCSTLSGKRVFAELKSNGDLADLAINGRNDADCDANELDAILSDYLK